MADIQRCEDPQCPHWDYFGGPHDHLIGGATTATPVEPPPGLGPSA